MQISPIKICENGYVRFTIFFRVSVQSMTRPGKMVENYRRPHLDRDFADNGSTTGCHPRNLKIYIQLPRSTNMHTATWLIVLTMIVVGTIPVLLIWLTTMPHPKLVLATLQAPRIPITLHHLALT